MTDEVQPTHDDVDTGTEATLPEDTAQTSGHDEWRTRYENLQPEYTRATQRLAELEAEREQWVQQAERQEQQGEYDEYEEYDFEDSHARQKVTELEAKIAAMEAKEAEKAESAYIDDQLEAIESEAGHDLSDKASNWIGRLAQEMRDPQGRPNVRAAYDEWIAVLEAEKKTWVKTKKAPKPGAGAAAKEKVNLDDPAARREYMAARLDELDS